MRLAVQSCIPHGRFDRLPHNRFFAVLPALISADPLLFTVPEAIATSCAFMMPVATPRDAIVFAMDHMKIQSMIRAGLFLYIAGPVFITLVVVALLRLAWQ